MASPGEANEGSGLGGGRPRERWATPAGAIRAGQSRRYGSGMGNRDNIAPMNGLRNRCSAAVVATALLAFPLAPARAAVVAAPTAAREAAPAAVVGLDADAPAQGATLTRAMRRAFAARGLSGGEEVNLSELRLALGCKGTSPECLAKGGERLGARRLIYGTLRRAEGEGWLLEATLLEVESGAVTSTRMPLTDADLEADRIDATAEAIASRLAPDVAISNAPAQGSGELATPPPPPPPPEPEPAGSTDAPAEEREGKLWFGWERPQPRWKLVGFGVSTGLLVVSGAATIGMGVWLTSKNGGFRARILEAAEASLTDSNELNDVDPSFPEAIDLCDYAAARPTDSNGNPLGEPGQVRNSSVVKACNDGDNIRTAQIGTGIMAGISGVSTVVFTLLLLVHRKPARESAWQRHRLQVGMDPAREGGLTLRVGGRF